MIKHHEAMEFTKLADIEADKIESVAKKVSEARRRFDHYQATQEIEIEDCVVCCFNLLYCFITISLQTCAHFHEVFKFFFKVVVYYYETDEILLFLGFYFAK